jgi:dienelactone hydrolase
MSDPCVLVSDAGGRSAALSAAERWLASRGTVTVVDLPADVDDAAGLAAIDAARRSLGPTAIIVGSRAGATLALMALSALTGVRAAICFDPELRYGTLTDRRPAQPLDLLPGMAGALQAHFGASAHQHQVDALERRLALQARPWQVFRYEAPATELLDPESSTGRLAWRRTERFLTQTAPGRKP